MEPITIAAIVGYLVKTIKENKAFKDFTADFTEAAINWIRPIFLKADSSPKDILRNLESNPDSKARKEAAEAAIAIELEDNPEALKLLNEMHFVIKRKQTQAQTSVTNSKNVNTGTISAGGNVFLGDSIK